MGLEPSGKMAVTPPTNDEIISIPRYLFDELKNEVDNLRDGEEFLAWGLGLIIGILGTTLFVAFWPFQGDFSKSQISTDPVKYELTFIVSFILLLFFYYRLYQKHKEQDSNLIRQIIENINLARKRNP